jgi:hypothetical protein
MVLTPPCPLQPFHLDMGARSTRDTRPEGPTSCVCVWCPPPNLVCLSDCSSCRCCCCSWIQPTAPCLARCVPRWLGCARLCRRPAPPPPTPPHCKEVYQRLPPSLGPHVTPPTLPQVSDALSHVLKRLRSAVSVQVPVAALLDLRVGAPPHRLTFLGVFLGLGFDRVPAPDRAALLPALLQDLHTFPAAHRSLCLRLFVKVGCLPGPGRGDEACSPHAR